MILKVWWSEAGWKSILLSALYRQHVRGHNGPWDWYIVLILQTVGQAHRVWVTCLKSACWGLKVRTIWPMSLLVLLLLLSPHFCQVVHIFSCVKRMWMNYIIKWKTKNQSRCSFWGLEPCPHSPFLGKMLVTFSVFFVKASTKTKGHETMLWMVLS